MKNQNNTSDFEALRLLKLEVDLLKERIDEFINDESYHLENNYVGFNPPFPTPDFQGGSAYGQLAVTDEVLFVDNNGEKVHGYISQITETWIEIVELDIYDNSTSKIHRFQSHILPAFFRKVISYGL